MSEWKGGETVKLRDAYICLDCEEIFIPEIFKFLDQPMKQDCCPNCGGKSSARLSRWLPTMNEHDRAQGVAA
jgi:DNA-directed RNA polymerase subunit RPC12/RpoP